MRLIKTFILFVAFVCSTFAMNDEHWSNITRQRYFNASNHIRAVYEVISGADKFVKLNCMQPGNLDKWCEELAGMLFFNRPLTTGSSSKEFVGFDKFNQAQDGYRLRDLDGSTEDVQKQIAFISGFIGQHYKKLFVSSMGSTELNNKFNLQKVKEEHRKSTAYRLRLMEIGAGSQLDWKLSRFADDLTDQETIGYYQQYAMRGRKLYYLSKMNDIKAEAEKQKNDKSVRKGMVSSHEKTCENIKQAANVVSQQLKNVILNKDEKSLRQKEQTAISMIFDKIYNEDIDVYPYSIIPIASLSRNKKIKEIGAYFKGFEKELAAIFPEAYYSYRLENKLKVMYKKKAPQVRKAVAKDTNFLMNKYGSWVNLAAALAAGKMDKYLRSMKEFAKELDKIDSIAIGEISFVPNAVFDAVNLNTLFLFEIENPDLRRLKELSKLTYLSIKNCKLTKINEATMELKELETLDLSSNKLNILPDNINKLEKLENLILSHNKIEKLPKALGKLSNLKNLDLTDNNLKEIPVAIIKDMKSLYEVIFTNNKISKLPEKQPEVSSKKFFGIDLSKNAIEVIPDWATESMIEKGEPYFITLDENPGFKKIQ